MIFTDRTITVRKGESRIDEPIVVYRGDYELEVRFTILNSRFKFMSGTNMIESEKASYGQLAILTPYGGNIFSDIVRCNDGSVTFVLTAEMLNQIEEVGLYSFQIRLMDYNKESRVSIPPIEFGIEVREPIASEDHDNSVNNAIVGYSIAKVVDPKEEKVGDTFDGSGNYNKTKWETGDRISEGKLNKIEEAIDKINKDETINVESLNKQIMANYSVLTSEIETEKRRIDSLARIENGETEGNTELLDIRIGKNAHEYTLAGDHVRAISSGEALLNDSISAEHIDFIGRVGNLFNGKYITGNIIGDNVSGVIFENTNASTRSAIIRVKPNTTYFITKKVSARFRIAANDVYPRHMMKIKRLIKDASYTSSESELYNGEMYRTYTFTTDADEYFLIVYVSNISEEPKMQIIEGDKEELFSNYELFFKVPIKTDNISKGKNLFDGTYLDGTLLGSGGGSGLLTGNPGKVAIINVKPNTAYTISKTPSNRFRIGLLQDEPMVGCTPYLIKGESNDDNLETSIVTREHDICLIIYVAYGEGVNPPEFMQVEEGMVRTSWETYGFKFEPQAKDYKDHELPSTPEHYGAIGNANYIDSDGNVWSDSLFKIPATDDTEALKKLFNNEYIEFPHGKKYLITDTLNVSSKLVKMLNGNGSKLVIKGDIIAINFEGTLNGSANPGQSGDKVFNEHGTIINGLHITSSNNEGTAIRVNKNFGGIIDKCDFSYLKIGCIIEGMNRNLIISNSHIYAMEQYGIYFTNTCDLHQINIIGNHISYCRKNIFLDDPNIYNMQVTGCDIETSSYPSTAEHDIHVYIENGFLEDLEIVGNTIEDHWCTDALIKFECLKNYRIAACVVSGNVIGNSKKNDISISGVNGLAIVGNSFKRSYGQSLKIEGTSKNITFTGNTIESYGGLLYCDNTNADIKNLTVSNNAVDGQRNMIYVNAGILESVNINNNTLSLVGVTNVDSSKAMVDISSKQINLSKIDNNLIYGAEALSTAIKIESTSVRKTNCKDNMSDNFNTDSDIYNINSQITIGNNI